MQLESSWPSEESWGPAFETCLIIKEPVHNDIELKPNLFLMCT